jgi:uncharacterized membrane protein YidH (DUF202 family)
MGVKGTKNLALQGREEVIKMKASRALRLSGLIITIVGMVISIIAIMQANKIESYENTLQGRLSSLLNGDYYTNQLNMWIDISQVGIIIAIVGVTLLIIGTAVWFIENWN